MVNEADFNEVVEKYVVRFKRLHELLFHAPKLVFVTIMPFCFEDSVDKYALLQEEVLKKVKASCKFIAVNVFQTGQKKGNMLNFNVELTDSFDAFNATVAEQFKSDEVQKFLSEW